ncbi:hypothetical protein CDL15_Pgr019380 [Punica granatum]|uniref:Uncharacterized protein n=1 Tax=Punica granatum TaxID=22663 RepID=A0A218XS01_PUNGR|nr:hypothetical protein CDL15_Pgr019380 [Punica granatum]
MERKGEEGRCDIWNVINTGSVIDQKGEMSETTTALGAATVLREHRATSHQSTTERSIRTTRWPDSIVDRCRASLNSYSTTTTRLKRKGKEKGDRKREERKNNHHRQRERKPSYLLVACVTPNEPGRSRARH